MRDVEEEGPAMSYLKIVMRVALTIGQTHFRTSVVGIWQPLLRGPTPAFRRLGASNSFMHCTAAAADTLLCNPIAMTPHPYPASDLAASLLLVGVW